MHLYERRATLQYVPPMPIRPVSFGGPSDLGNGWQLVDAIGSAGAYEFLRDRHGTAYTCGDMGDASCRHALCFNLVKLSETPELDIEKVSESIVRALNQHLDEIASTLPLYGESNFIMPKVHSINFWDEGLPGELLDLRLQCYVVHYDD